MTLNKDIFKGKETLVDALSPYKCVKLAYDGSNNVEYIGKHLREISPSEDDLGWVITKLTWSGSYITQSQSREGTWTDRTTGWL